jgi:hypothetical protein
LKASYFCRITDKFTRRAKPNRIIGDPVTSSGVVELTALLYVLLLTDVASMALVADADAGGYDSWCQGAGRVSFPS